MLVKAVPFWSLCDRKPVWLCVCVPDSVLFVCRAALSPVSEHRHKSRARTCSRSYSLSLFCLAGHRQVLLGVFVCSFRQTIPGPLWRKSIYVMHTFTQTSWRARIRSHARTACFLLACGICWRAGVCVECIIYVHT